MIELIEFKVEHLPEIFNQVFQKITTLLTEKLKDKKGFEHLSVSVISRSLLGLFFAYLMSEQFTGITLADEKDTEGSMADFGFDYFADIYLQGLLGNADGSEKRKI